MWEEWRWNWNGNEGENEKWRMGNENEIVNESERKMCLKWDGWKDNCKTHAHVLTYSSTKNKQLTHPPSPPHNHT